MVAARMELAVMVSQEELEHLKDIIDNRIDTVHKSIRALRSKAMSGDYKGAMTALSNDLRVATMLKAKLDVSFH
jgi:signal transduction histidine kinase